MPKSDYNELRYFVQSSHGRGERRVYYVLDRQQRFKQVSINYTSKVKADKVCAKLNRP